MKDFLEYDPTNINPGLTKSIGLLINLILSEKKFQFDKEELAFETAELQSNGVLRLNEQHLEIADSVVFYDELYNHFSNLFSFTLTPNVDEAFNFTDKIEKVLGKEGYRAGVSSFFQNLRQFVLFKIHKEFNSDFSDYTKGLSKAAGQIFYYFNNSYCAILPYLSSPVESLYENVKHLMNEVTDPTVTFNSNVGEIRLGVVSYCHVDLIKGDALLKYAIAQNPVVDNINSAIIQGLYFSKRDSFWPEIEKLWKHKEHRLAVMLGLSGVKVQSDLEGRKYYDLLNVSDFSETELFNLPQVYRSVIDTEIISENLRNDFFKKLEELIVSPNQNLRLTVLSELSFIRNFDDERIQILKRLLLTSDFNKEQIPLIGHVFINNRSLQGFIEIVHIYADKFKLDFNPDVFSSAFYYFKNDQPETFSIELIKLLTHDKGEVRFIGSRILSYVTPHRGRFVFQTDILKLDALTQYKLWMSILSETKEPGHTLPMLLPLLYTPFQFVKEAFIGRVELLTEEYGSSVLETLEVELDLTKPQNKFVYERIKNYCEDFWDELAKKRDIKELNPQYIQSEIYTLYSRNHAKSFNKSLSENVEKHSVFMQFAKQVILAKGGGWKHEKHSKVEKLGKFSSSFQLPRSYFIAPESFDWNFKTNYVENWQSKFKEWEAIISS